MGNNGDTYEGQYVNDEKHGAGKFTWGKGPWEGHVYIGAWKGGKMEGQGEYYTPKAVRGAQSSAFCTTAP